MTHKPPRSQSTDYNFVSTVWNRSSCDNSLSLNSF